PIALRGFVRRLGPPGHERDLRPRSHRAASATAAASDPRATAAAGLARLGVAVINRRVLVDLLTVDVRRKPERPFLVARLMAQIHVAHVGVAVDLVDDRFAYR